MAEAYFTALQLLSELATVREFFFAASQLENNQPPVVLLHGATKKMLFKSLIWHQNAASRCSRLCRSSVYFVLFLLVNFFFFIVPAQVSTKASNLLSMFHFSPLSASIVYPVHRGPGSVHQRAGRNSHFT